MKSIALKMSLLVAAIVSLPAAAHHSANMFDPSKSVVLEATVKEFQWSNPHIWIQVMVPNANGGEQEWSIEGGSPNLVGRQGWKRNSFKPGEKVTITVRPLRNGDPGGSFVSATFADGRKLGNGAGVLPAPGAKEAPAY
jgi:hypothetical protein